MFSKELEQSIASLFDQAQDQNLEYLTIEHLLLMLISDYDVRQALETNDVNLNTLRENLEEWTNAVEHGWLELVATYSFTLQS